MKYKIENLKINIDTLLDDSFETIVAKKLHLKPEKMGHLQILRRSLDARFHQSSGIFYVYQLAFDYPFDIKRKGVIPIHSVEESDENFSFPYFPSAEIHPVIIGTGPAGLFAALRLLDYGIPSILIEQGKPIEQRNQDVERFWENGALQPYSNIQFGMGGAGTFSDGKLRSRIKSNHVHYVLEKLVTSGADPKIRYENKPHIGTDRFKPIIQNIQQVLIAGGCEFHFETRLTELVIEHHRITGIVLNGNEKMKCSTLILAIGNSARETFELLERQHVALAAKPFAVGIRIEHEQSLIDQYTYGKYCGHPLLESAEYQLTFHDQSTGRHVYSFCNCPGGYVIGASSEPNALAINGMSDSSRNGRNANSALVVNVTNNDFPSTTPLGGMLFQRELERQTFALGGGDFIAPVMYVGDFLGRNTASVVTGTIKPGFCERNIRECLPTFVSNSLANALETFTRQIKGFDTGLMTATETRTSSPVRILRDKETMQSLNTAGLYPIGEGSGYAGGIMSSAVDGIKVADLLAQHNQPTPEAL